MKKIIFIILISTTVFILSMLIIAEIFLLNELGFTLISNNSNMQREIIKYENIIPNLDESINNVYFGIAIDKFYIVKFTAFSIEYENKYYLITAKHSIINKDKIIKNIRFKSNSGSAWIYPELLYCKDNFSNNDDLAIFYSDKINNGFKIDTENDKPNYVLGNKYLNINIIRNFNIKTKKGESGSPIIDSDGEVMGIIINTDNRFYTPINSVVQAIDNLN